MLQDGTLEAGHTRISKILARQAAKYLSYSCTLAIMLLKITLSLMGGDYFF
jgi:hypothetical protein